MEPEAAALPNPGSAGWPGHAGKTNTNIAPVNFRGDQRSLQKGPVRGKTDGKGCGAWAVGMGDHHTAALPGSCQGAPCSAVHVAGSCSLNVPRTSPGEVVCCGAHATDRNVKT